MINDARRGYSVLMVAIDELIAVNAALMVCCKLCECPYSSGFNLNDCEVFLYLFYQAVTYILARCMTRQLRKFPSLCLGLRRKN